MKPRLILATFSGIGLLDRAFEQEWPDACLLRAPERLWGGDIRDWHAPPGIFEGVIGGPPCPSHSRLRAIVSHHDKEPERDLIPEFERIVREGQPAWFVMENVVLAPPPAIDGYVITDLVLNNRHVPDEPGGVVGPEQHRVRRFWFGTRDGRRLSIDVALVEHPVWKPAVLASGLTIGETPRGRRIPLAQMGFKTKAAYQEMLRLQGLPDDFLDESPFHTKAKVRAVGNGVPLPMGRAIARAVRQAVDAD